MVVSSRTPEGSPNRCPICGSDVRIEPSCLFGDAPCPVCGQLLWFLNLGSQQRCYRAEQAQPLRERVLDLIAAQLKIRREELLADAVLFSDLGADSLDVVELVMQLEEEFG